MSLLSVVNDVCAVVGVHQMTSVFSNINNNRTAFEMLALANEMAKRIAYDTREWSALATSTAQAGTVEVSGITGVSFTKIPLPANYQRLLLTSGLWRLSAPMSPMLFISDYNEWAQRQLQGTTTPANGAWIINNREIHIIPALAAGDSAGFLYLDKNCIRLVPGPGFGDAFIADNDEFRLEERLLKLGMIWQWKANKGSPYAEDMATFMDAVSRASGADKPSPILVDRVPLSAARASYPYPTPTPADWSWPL
jgi:hypothetical protein